MVIAICWTLVSSISFVSEYFFIVDLITLKRLAGSFSFWPEFIASLIMGLLGGFIGGYLLVFKMNVRYRNKSFAFGIINSAIVFILAYVCLATVGLFVIDLIYFLFHGNFSSAVLRSVDNVLFNILSPSFLINIILWGLLISCTQFMLQVNDKFGPGVLWKFITGKYYHPGQEERIFMFLDLKSSTTIAETMSSNKYFRLLKEVFNDITEPILNSQGEIYQYIGDEVVVTWPVEIGLADNNSLQCFYRITQALQHRKEHYIRQYDVFPSFKAGLHIGEATIGEIGVIKKDIVFSGDVLNTTSRIQGACNNYNVNILLSADLIGRLQLNTACQQIPLGDMLLKGRKEKISLYTVKCE
jgi:adenylate cyclase